MTNVAENDRAEKSHCSPNQQVFHEVPILYDLTTWNYFTVPFYRLVSNSQVAGL